MQKFFAVLQVLVFGMLATFFVMMIFEKVNAESGIMSQCGAGVVSMKNERTVTFTDGAGVVRNSTTEACARVDNLLPEAPQPLPATEL